MSDLVIVGPELDCGMRNHLLGLDVVLAVEYRVRAEIDAILRAHDGDGVMCVGRRVRRLEIELAIDIAAVCVSMRRDVIESVVAFGRLEPELPVPERLRAARHVANEPLELAWLPFLDRLFRRGGRRVVGIAIRSRRRGRINLDEPNANEDR